MIRGPGEGKIKKVADRHAAAFSEQPENKIAAAADSGVRCRAPGTYWILTPFEPKTHSHFDFWINSPPP